MSKGTSSYVMASTNSNIMPNKNKTCFRGTLSNLSGETLFMFAQKKTRATGIKIFLLNIQTSRSEEIM